MNKLWILAAAGDDTDEGQIMTGEPVYTQTEETTTADGTNGGAAEQAPAGPKPNPLMQYAPLVVIFIIMYMLLFRGPKRKQQKHQQMVSSLQRNDRVQTIGGLLGTIVDVRDDEIVLKIDESNNTKVKITAGAVSKVLSKEAD